MKKQAKCIIFQKDIFLVGKDHHLVDTNNKLNELKGIEFLWHIVLCNIKYGLGK